MTIEDLKKIQYNAEIYAKDLKDGMKIIDEDDCVVDNRSGEGHQGNRAHHGYG